MIGGFVRNNLSCSKAVSASSDQKKCLEALRSLKNGRPFSSRHNIKLLRVAMQPISCGDLVGVGLDATGTNDVAQEYAGWNSKDAL